MTDLVCECDRGHPVGDPYGGYAPTGNLLKSPWQFKQYGQSGIPVSELFPHVARHVDDLCILNSVHGTNPAHGGAVLKLHTGSDTFVRPSMGSWIAYGLGTENRSLPGFNNTLCLSPALISKADDIDQITGAIDGALTRVFG